MSDRSIRTILVQAALVLAVALPPAASLAGSEGWGWAQPGFYAGLAGDLAFGTGIEDELEDLSGVPVDVDPSLGLNARAGYRFHPHFAVEGHYEWTSGFDVGASGGPDVLELEGHAFTADAKGYLTTGRWQPFALVGLGFLYGELSDKVGAGFSADETAFAARFGAGFDTYLTENLAVTLDASYVVPTDDLDGFDYVSFGWGFQYHFGGERGWEAASR
jgi:opacity protein-like surface antigen